MPTLVEIISDVKNVPRLVQALRMLESEPKLVDALRQLYHATHGIPVSRDAGNRVRGPTISSCSRIGARISTALQPEGRRDEMMWVGYIEVVNNEERWFMRAAIRQALNELGWFTVLPNDGSLTGRGRDELNDMRQSFIEQIRQASNDSSAARQARLKLVLPQPKKVLVQTWAFIRNADVVAEALHRAAGICENCKKPAPFNRAADGLPYLEVHHKIKLADGGDDTLENAIAICPNCHRLFHFGRAPSTVL